MSKPLHVKHSHVISLNIDHSRLILPRKYQARNLREIILLRGK